MESFLISPSSLRFREACPETVRSLREADPSLSPIVAEMLAARGYSTPQQVERYFHPNPETLHSPLLLKDMDRAVSLLNQSLSDGERVLIQGDYDCDGICATTLLLEALQEMGADVDFHVPDRFKEGYGLSELAVERCIKEGFALLISVDCGSSSHREIEMAKAAGIKIIVTDHHAVPLDPPKPHAFINPQQKDCAYPFKGICGTGVAFKLVQALRGRMAAEPAHFLDLVALATVADVVPLVDENRVFVQLGLQELGRSRREGLIALLEVAGGSGRDVVDAFTVGFTLGPRLNAAGRMEHAKLGVELLRSRSLGEARKLATHLDCLNEARKECEKDIQQEIENRLHSEPRRWKQGAIVEWGEGWHEGVLGITAGRLAEKYGVPTLVIATEDGRAKGSGRSPENVDLYLALKNCESLLLKYGGHPRAGGFSLSAQDLPDLSVAFLQSVQDLRRGPAPIWLDACLTLAQADLDLVKDLERMEPFGEANPKPSFLLLGVDIVNRRLVGRQGDHLQLEVEQLGLRRRAIAFRQADLVDELCPQEFRYDLRCQLSRDNFRGQEQLKVQVSGVVRPPCQAPEENEAMVADLRHLRTRRKALLQVMDGRQDLRAICRDPQEACKAYPQFDGRFHTYLDCPQGLQDLLLLSPPSSLGQLSELMERVKPQRLTVLFGCQELERYALELSKQTWSRETAITLWHLLRQCGEGRRSFAEVTRIAKERLSLSAEVVRDILAGFTETEALVCGDEEHFEFGRANGMRLEETRAFKCQFHRLHELEALRRFFSNPDLEYQFAQRWPWFGAESARTLEEKNKELGDCSVAVPMDRKVSLR